MSRYRYEGPYNSIEVEGKHVNIGDEVVLKNDAFVEEQTTRGYHIFVRVHKQDSQSEPDEPEPIAKAPANDEAAEKAAKDAAK